MKHFKHLIWGAVLLLLIFIVYKAGRLALDYKQRNSKLIVNLYEAYAVKDQVVKLDTTALKVLCLGNSITHHAPAKGDIPGADSLWRGDWGMCASRPELDYVHQLESMFRNYNRNTVFKKQNLWEWEQNFSINKDSLFGEECKDIDLIILKIGENVPDNRSEEFQLAFDELTAYCLKYTNVIIAGLYWKAPRKEQAMISAAMKYRLPYVPLFWIYENYHDKVIAHVGDTVYDARMQPYPIATEFICTHPNDEGMRMISEAIFNVVRFEK